MPHNKNTDRTRRRILRWIALLGSVSVAVTLFWPELFPGEPAEQGAHDTAAGTTADSLDPLLSTQIIELPADAPSLPPLLPPYLQDDELMAILAADYTLIPPARQYVQIPFRAERTMPADVAETQSASLPPTPATAESALESTVADMHASHTGDTTPAANVPEPPDTLADIGARDLTRDPAPEPAHSDPQETQETQDASATLTTIGARDFTRPDTSPVNPSRDTSHPPIPSPNPESPALSTIAARDLSTPPPHSITLPADMPPRLDPQTTPTETVVQDDSKGEFVKKRFVLNGNNLWNSLQNSDLNPHLKKQLEPLRRRLTQSNINRVHILYTDYVKSGESKLENSKILLVDGLRGANLVWSFYAREKDRTMSFYDYDGNAPELAMDRIPLQYSHITSHFNPARRHPITGRIQAHTGVDFKAAYGAPVHATGKGVVSFAGWQSGYGRLVIIQHDNGYETRYAHLSAIDVEAGDSVARGAKVGKVGNSGVSTGTHLHFEVRINGTPFDPMTVKIPSVQPLPANYMKAWHYRAEQYRLAMNELSSTAKK